MEQYKLNINKLVNEFASKKLNGLDYTEIRKELHQRNIEPEMINQEIRMIDVRVLNSELSKKNFFKERNMVNGRKFFYKTKRNFD